MATLAMPKLTMKLFNNISDDEDDTHFCLMARGNKVLESSTSSSHPSSTSSVENDFGNEEKQHEAFMIKEFGKKGFKEIKKLMEKLEQKRESLDRQEDLLIHEKGEKPCLREVPYRGKN